MTANIRYTCYSVLTVVTVGSDYAVSTDERNAPAAEPSGSPNAEGMSRDSGRKRVRKVTIRRIDILGDCVETGEAVFTNGVEVVKTKSRSYFCGGMSTRREWGVSAAQAGTAQCAVQPEAQARARDKFTEERRFEGCAADGSRIDYVVTESSDCGVVTNSVSTYDLLGRLIAVETPCAGLGGSPSLATAITSNTYDGTSSHKLSSTYTAGDVVRTTTYLYNDFGEQVGTVLDGITNRTDTTYEQHSNEWWKVETASIVGSSTNSLTIVRTQLTGLSDVCRRHEVTMASAKDIPLRFNPSTTLPAATSSPSTRTRTAQTSSLNPTPTTFSATASRRPMRLATQRTAATICSATS